MNARWQAAWERGQRGWPERFPLAQFPNAPLLVFFGAAIVVRVASGSLHDLAWALGRVALTIWAAQELTDGVNWFRRGLGLVSLVLIVVSLADHAP